MELQDEAGEEQQDRDSDAGLGYHGCPVGHIREYCMGYKSGSSEESSALDTQDMGKFKRELKPCFNPKYIKGETDWNSGGAIRRRAVYMALECQGIMTLFTSKMKLS